MRALVADPTLTVAGRPNRTGRGRAAAAPVLPLTIRDVRTPEPLIPGWVLVQPALSGICRADLVMLAGDDEDSVLTAYHRRGAVVPGHEIVGVVERATHTRWAREGHRVMVEPTLRCAHKGLPECRRCRAGETQLCENMDRAGAVCSGSGVGASEGTGGGWSDGFLVHEDMLVPADGISDQRGVLAEPAASALHAAMRWIRRGDRAVVIGSGALSRLLVATLRRLYPDLDITVLYDARSAFRPRLGKRARQLGHVGADQDSDFAAIRALGAARVWRGYPEQLLQRVAELVGARMLRPTIGGMPVLDAGVDVVFDCRANPASTDLSLRLLRAGGTLVLCGSSSRHDMEWPLVWSRELTVAGAAAYGREPNGRRTFAIVREWLTDTAFPVDNIVTHRFPLEEYQRALDTAIAGIAAGAVKVVFQGPVAALKTRRTRAEHDEVNGETDLSEPVLLESTAARVRARMPKN
ncbi:MAG: zinc-binding dehydrogenase [Candidatus Dormibacteria bacterium]